MLLCLCLCFSLVLSAPSPKLLGQFPIYATSFLNIDRWDASSPWMLLSSAFGLLEGDGVWIVPDIGKAVQSGVNNTQATDITSDITWPNEVRVVPPGTVSGSSRLLSVGSGFLVPTKTTGAIHLIDTANNNQLHKITKDKDGWFYHRVRWYDIDKDGRQDIFTCRATKPITSAAGAELIWLRQPASNPLGQTWEEHKLADGCDFLWEIFVLGNATYPVIIAAEYLGERVSLFYPTTGDWTGNVATVVIDDTIGPGFDVKAYDTNSNGLSHIVVTNHKGDGNGGVYSYEVPTNWKTGNWKRYTIAEGFQIRETGYNQAAPGGGQPFYPKIGMTGKQWIALSGDGSQLAYQLVPNGSSGWSFTRDVLVDTQGTVGQVAVEDVNNDGYSDVFVPAYDSGTVYVFSYSG